MSPFKGELPPVSGSYLLWLYLPRRHSIEVGKLGRHIFKRGWYGYCGSAYGPGGLRGRLGHHLRPVVRFHWHIDYLRQPARIKQIWLAPGVDAEHRWPSQLAEHAEVSQPIPGFGASDCRCPSHLFYLSRQAVVKDLSSRLAETESLVVLKTLRAR